MNLKRPIIISEHDYEVKSSSKIYHLIISYSKGNGNSKAKPLINLRRQTQYNLENSNSHHL